MQRALLPLLAAGILAATAAASQAATQPLSWQGTWKIAEKGTAYPAGFPKIENHAITVDIDDGTKLKYTDNWDIAGKHGSSSFDGAWDDKPYPTSDGHMMAYKHVSAKSYADHWTDDKGTVGEDHCTFTADDAHMNCTGSVTPKGGKKASYKEHWDKVQ
jgi:hypothetical protein